MPKMKPRHLALVATVETPLGQPDVVVPATKNGPATTEFWITLAVTVVSMLTAVGVIDPSNSQHIQELVQVVATGVAGLVPAVYALARAFTKARVKQSQALVLAAAQDRQVAA
jgi:hypothetical protein